MRFGRRETSIEARYIVLISKLSPLLLVTNIRLQRERRWRGLSAANSSKRLQNPALTSTWLSTTLYAKSADITSKCQAILRAGRAEWDRMGHNRRWKSVMVKTTEDAAVA
jgi:hypothetical protein